MYAIDPSPQNDYYRVWDKQEKAYVRCAIKGALFFSLEDAEYKIEKFLGNDKTRYEVHTFELRRMDNIELHSNYFTPTGFYTG